MVIVSKLNIVGAFSRSFFDIFLLFVLKKNCIKQTKNMEVYRKSKENNFRNLKLTAKTHFIRHQT